jgi:hypothetical protein
MDRGTYKAGRSDDGEEQENPPRPGWLICRGNQSICINYKTERKHYRFGFRHRETLMIWSIWREVNVLVPFPSDSSPMTLKTSSSGAANFDIIMDA